MKKEEAWRCGQRPIPKPKPWKDASQVEGEQRATTQGRSQPRTKRECLKFCFPDRTSQDGPGASLSHPISSLLLPQSSGTFQRLFMRYFYKIWDLRRRLQRLAFSGPGC